MQLLQRITVADPDGSGWPEGVAAACHGGHRMSAKEDWRRHEVDVLVARNRPMLDVRRGWDVDARLRDIAVLEAAGVSRIVVTTCGDDPVAADETVRRHGEDVVSVVHAEDGRDA
ncbi:hypothetical protein [Frankia sp. Cas3]|uniref:hypothetical protein n=1 Tax=Frankia sp. Cas3 TaxID=3073926 RepID=UPI002AD35567|nr:hypothetical protein [Frankia sp. Cas3]